MAPPVSKILLPLFLLEPINTHLTIGKVLYEIEANNLVNHIYSKSSIFLQRVKEEEA